MNKTLKRAIVGILMVVLTIAPVDISRAENITPNIVYSVHVQGDGWMIGYYNGHIAGKTGEGKQLESINVSVNSENMSGTVQYRVHQQDYGWTEWVNGGTDCGITGQSKRLESVELRLTGDLEQNYDVCYSVHGQDYGWQDWVRNGELGGTQGQGKRLEAIRIKLVPKGQIAADTKPSVSIETHVQDYGWLGGFGEGSFAGTSGQGKRLEAFKINLLNSNGLGNINFRAHVQDYGWQGYSNSGEMAGSTGSGKRIEAIQISLTGELQQLYDVYYRVHVQNYGWSGWAKNGEAAGTSGLSARLESMQMFIVSKGSAAPGSSDYAYRTLASEGGYRIMVNKQACCVTIYAGAMPIKSMICSPGAGTPLGNFNIGQQYRWWTLLGGVKGQFCSRITGNVLFHSVPYSAANNRALITKYYNQLGQPVSHGCVRLSVSDAIWIYNNCPPGTSVTIYNSPDPGPLGRPAPIIIPAGQTWDPTDPTL